jgi:protoheme IX farnesyltransferase
MELLAHPSAPAHRGESVLGPWARLLAFGAVAGTALAVISGAAGWDTAHRVLAAVAVPPLAALVVLAWTSARPLLPAALSSLVLFGAAALFVGRDFHIVFAALAFGAACFTWAQVMRGNVAETGNGAWRDYVTLTKPRVMSLLLLTGAAGAFVGAGAVPDAGVFIVMIVGLALACGGASALNHYLDRDIDKLMGSRTASRPVASGRLDPEYALEFGIALSAVSFVLLDSLVNLPTAVLALAGNLFYVLVYTRLLKRSTPQNIVIGGAAGAVPPLVGYASTAGHLALAAWVMFGIVFLWTPPHFWALALMLKDHYANAKVPMLPVVRGDRETARQIFWYTLVLVGATLAPAAFGMFGLVYGVSALLLGALLTWMAVALWRETSRPRAVRLFHFSMLYLALLFVAMAVDAVL